MTVRRARNSKIETRGGVDDQDFYFDTSLSCRNFPNQFSVFPSSPICHSVEPLLSDLWLISLLMSETYFRTKNSWLQSTRMISKSSGSESHMSCPFRIALSEAFPARGVREVLKGSKHPHHAHSISLQRPLLSLRFLPFASPFRLLASGSLYTHL